MQLLTARIQHSQSDGGVSIADSQSGISITEQAEALLQRADPLLGLEMERVVVMDADSSRIEIFCRDASVTATANWES